MAIIKCLIFRCYKETAVFAIIIDINYFMSLCV
jgi:hypothetical protein